MFREFHHLYEELEPTKFIEYIRMKVETFDFNMVIFIFLVSEED